MPTGNNKIDDLLGVYSRDRNAMAAGLGRSHFNTGYNRLVAARYDNSYFTHFNGGTTIPAGLVLTSEGTTTAAATYGIGLGGEATITSDDVAAKTEQLSTQLNWQANRQPDGQPLYAAFRWKTGATITSSEYWCGLTDAAADTDPIALSASSTFTTSVPTDGVYMGYSATPTSGSAFTTGGNQHTAISILTNTNTISGHGAGIFVAATYYLYEFEVDNLGNCKFYVNGQLLANQALALDPTKPLCASIWAAPRTTASAAVTVDYMGVSGV